VTTTPELPADLKVAVRTAIGELAASCGTLISRILGDGQGGAWVELTGVDPGLGFTQDETFVIFLLPFNLPGADVYPMFVRPDLSRVNGEPLGPAMQPTSLAWPGEPSQRAVIQISRRTRGAFATQTAAQKVAKVLAWLRSG